MNRVELIGGLTRDPEATISARTGTATWFTTIAVNGTRYDSETRATVVKTTFVSLSAYGWMAEELIDAGYEKGDEIYVLGELDQYEIEKDGVKDRKTRVRPQVVQATRKRFRASTPPPPAPSPWLSDEPPF